MNESNPQKGNASKKYSPDGRCGRDFCKYSRSERTGSEDRICEKSKIKSPFLGFYFWEILMFYRNFSHILANKCRVIICDFLCFFAIFK